VGKWSGKLCFLLDFLKGMLPVLAAQWIQLDIQPHQRVYVVIGTLFATVLGHIFPVFLKFKGGKGVSTAAGAVMALNWSALLVALAVWVVVFLASRYVSLASIAAAAVLPIVAWVFYLIGYGSELARSPEVLVFLTVVALLAILRHRSNIQRLLKGEENRFGKK
jgi:glycerol-3-phosphate acyltransferase PlsY